jgi:flagellar motor protein MotB
MKLAGVIGTAILSLTLGASSAAYAQEQHDQQEEQKVKPEEKKTQPEKSAKPEEKPAAQPEKNAKPEEKNAKQEEKNTKPEEKNAQEEKNAKPAERNAQDQHAAGNGGGRIPADKFKANFGQQHTFRVSQGDYSSGRFQYGGYSFGFGGAWPSNWLYTQDVYVIEIDGMYYLCNPMYPGVNLAISVTL